MTTPAPMIMSQVLIFEILKKIFMQHINTYLPSSEHWQLSDDKEMWIKNARGHNKQWEQDDCQLS